MQKKKLEQQFFIVFKFLIIMNLIIMHAGNHTDILGRNPGKLKPSPLHLGERGTGLDLEMNSFSL